MKSLAFVFTKEHVNKLLKFDPNFISLSFEASTELQKLNKIFKTSDDYIKEEDIIKAIDKPIYELVHSWINFRERLKNDLNFHGISLGSLIELNFELFLRDIAKYIEILGGVHKKEILSNAYIFNDLCSPNNILPVFFEQKNILFNKLKSNLKLRIKSFLINFAKPLLAQYQLKSIKYDMPNINSKKILFIPNTNYDIQTINLIIKELNTLYKPIIISTSKQLSTGLKKQNVPFCTIKSFLTSKIKKQVNKEKRRLNKILESLKTDGQFQNNFVYKGIKIWPLIKDEFFYIFKKHFPEIIMYILVIEDLIKNKKINAVVACIDAHRVGKTIIQTANKEGIPTLVIQQGITDMRFGYIPLFAQKVAVWGVSSKKFYVRNKTNPERIILTGCPRFDDIINRKFSSEKVYEDLKLDKTKKIITYATHVILSSKPTLEKEIVFKSLIKTVEKLKDYQLVVKLHPADSFEFYKNVAKNAGHPEIVIIKDCDLHNLLYASDIIITRGSTVGLEALMFNKPVITIQLEQGPNMSPFIGSGAVVEVYQEKDIEKAIFGTIMNVNVLKKLEFSRNEFVKFYVSKLDGKSSQRVAKLIEKL